MSDSHHSERGGGYNAEGATTCAMAEKLFVGAIVMTLAISCGQEDTPMHLQAVQPSPGGNLAALTTIESDDQQILVAPAGHRLFMRGFDDGAWSERTALWPQQIDEAGLGVFDGIEQGMRDEKLTPERYFTAHQGRLWTVATPLAGQPPLLLSSDERGRYWEVVALPEELQERGTGRSVRPVARPLLRLSATGDEFFVDDGMRLWRMTVGADEVDVGDVEWEKVSLEGLPLPDDDREDVDSDDEKDAMDRRDAMLPSRLRHYLPARGEEGSEFATVYGRQLKVYRREAGMEDFELLSRFDALDRHLVRVDSQDVLFLVDSDVVYRSTDGGENWEELSIARDSLAPQSYRHLVVFEGDGDSKDDELWLLGERGGLWRSGDGGEQWEEAVEHDPDGRGLTGLVRENETSMWAATAGRGVIRSDDGGSSWEATNTGLRAGNSYDASLVDNGVLYVGTDAGLVERIADGEGVLRDWRDDRATSALYWDHEEKRLIRGTMGGGIIVDVDGDEEAPELAPLSESDVIEYLPPHLRDLRPAPAAIVDLVPHSGTTEIVAWSHRRGPLISGDTGATWRRLQLGEAFLNAIEGSVVTQFVGMADQTYFVVTRTRERSGATQLWRSVDGGATWQAIHSLMENLEETPMQLIQLPGGEGLLRADGSRLALSTDLGETWTNITGPWDSGQLLGMAIDDDQVVVVLELNHTTMIAWLDDPREGGEVTRSHHLIWPSSEAAYRTRPVALEVRNEEILLNEGGRIYTAKTPRRTTEGPAHVSALIGMGIVLLLTTLAFGYLRAWESS